MAIGLMQFGEETLVQGENKVNSDAKVKLDRIRVEVLELTGF